MAHALSPSQAYGLRKPDVEYQYDRTDFALFDVFCTGPRRCKSTSFKVVEVRDGECSPGAQEDGPPQIDYAAHDYGAPRPVRCIARASDRPLSAICASLVPPQTVDPSAPHARIFPNPPTTDGMCLLIPLMSLAGSG